MKVHNWLGILIAVTFMGCASARLDENHQSAAHKYIVENKYDKLEKVLSDSGDIKADSSLLNTWAQAAAEDGNCRKDIFQLLLSKGALLYQSDGSIRRRLF